MTEEELQKIEDEALEEELKELLEAACMAYRNTEVRVLGSIHTYDMPECREDLRTYNELSEGEKAHYRIKLLPVHRVYAKALGYDPKPIETSRVP